MALVALDGMRFSKMKTYQWLTALVVNFFFTILIVEPCKVIVFTLFVAGRKKPIWDQDHLDADEVLPTIYYDLESEEKGLEKLILKFYLKMFVPQSGSQTSRRRTYQS